MLAVITQLSENSWKLTKQQDLCGFNPDHILPAFHLLVYNYITESSLCKGI